MAKYVLKFNFDSLGSCLWAGNDAAIIKHGYDVEELELPISKNLKIYLLYLQAYHDCMRDWDKDDKNPSPWWTDEDSAEFERKAEFAYEQLCKELGEEYEIVNETRLSDRE